MENSYLKIQVNLTDLKLFVNGTGLRQIFIASKLDISPIYLSQILNLKKNPSDKIIRSMERLFDITIVR